MSPIAVQMSKLSLNYSQDHTVEDGLRHIGNINMTMLQTSDMIDIQKAAAMKTKPAFPPVPAKADE
eukprot:CAMPEP_0119156946 /NCGR_PEP_ID=MMETSP1310-20130426/52513_1 /TAXON_ID=464262 /ORGANISM="Genus nov. species nov., Strain RCC2339" /LENGTH=65 /DNA_ID=CAMNT_0007149561 /DNA_START=452 /DNA_END=649 /DNA_ORIENTATION=-